MKYLDFGFKDFFMKLGWDNEIYKIEAEVFEKKTLFGFLKSV
jgi:hypothetical protein